ncbi:hypothetical protein K438DRAFT_1930011 [Mycena galopus ATCC 62051]|nr:hypothetical protein K438DRAFT_1930011 [Mycena galopus ATCC 62051]
MSQPFYMQACLFRFVAPHSGHAYGVVQFYSALTSWQHWPAPVTLGRDSGTCATHALAIGMASIASQIKIKFVGCAALPPIKLLYMQYNQLGEAAQIAANSSRIWYFVPLRLAKALLVLRLHSSIASRSISAADSSTPNGEVDAPAPRPWYKPSIPVFALVPPIVRWLTGGDHFKDLLLLLILIFYLQQLVKRRARIPVNPFVAKSCFSAFCVLVKLLKLSKPRPGDLSSILQYFGILLLEKGELNHLESLELAGPVLAQNHKDGL